MFKFNKKKKDNTVSMLVENEDYIVEILHNHLELIRGLKKNEKIICDAIMNQQQAINDLQNQMETLQQLINRNEGV